MAASANRKRLHNNQTGEEIDFRRVYVGLVCVIHPQPQLFTLEYDEMR